MWLSAFVDNGNYWRTRQWPSRLTGEEGEEKLLKGQTVPKKPVCQALVSYFDAWSGQYLHGRQWYNYFKARRSIRTKMCKWARTTKDVEEDPAAGGRHKGGASQKQHAPVRGSKSSGASPGSKKASSKDSPGSFKTPAKRKMDPPTKTTVEKKKRH